MKTLQEDSRETICLRNKTKNEHKTKMNGEAVKIIKRVKRLRSSFSGSIN